MRTIVLLAVAGLVSACGDNGAGPPDAGAQARCEPPAGPLPTEGPFADPLAIPLPPTCVVGGLREVPGRWFVVAPESTFNFFYPKFEGDCETGFRRANYLDEDHDLSDDAFTFHTWSDGTRIYYRYYYRFEIPNEAPFEFAHAFAACLLPDGTMAAIANNFDTDRGPRMTEQRGERFAHKDALASGLALVGELGSRGPDQRIVGFNVVVDGDHAYVVGPTGFEVVDVSDPAAPVHVAHVDGRYNDVKVLRGATTVAAYVSPISDQETTRVIDITDPTAPVLGANLPEYSHSVFVDTTAATPALYLATYTNDVPKYDLTVPLSPVRVGAVTLAGDEAGVHDLFAQGDTIYANNTIAGLVVVDTGPGLATATELGRTPSSYSHASWAGTAGGRAVVLHGDEGMTGTPEGGAFLRVLDGDPTSETFLADIGRYQSRPEVGIHNFQLVGDRVYIAYYQDGVRVVDLSDPTQPTEVAHYNTWDVEATVGNPFEGALGIRVVGDLIYVADSERGLLILRPTP